MEPDMYRLLLEESEKRKLPTHYITDLTIHDREAILKHPDCTEAIWGLRECGTHLFLKTAYSPDKPKLMNWVEAIFSTFLATWYHIKNGKIKKVPKEKALNILIEWSKRGELSLFG